MFLKEMAAAEDQETIKVVAAVPLRDHLVNLSIENNDHIYFISGFVLLIST